MADSVRRILEEMVPELDALEEVGYFSKTEIRSIVQRRQDLEYALQRRRPEKADFLRSIEYEKSLERLRVLRKKERNITTSRKKTTLTDYCIIRRTHKLYERMLRKFKGDLSLWNDWIQFCSSCRSSKQMSKVLTRTMQLFPTQAAVWTYAAAWELEYNHNATVARSLMQTGIRMCKNDASLWVEYFRMELLYAARLVARRQVLGVEADGDGIDDATRALLSGGVAKVVYLNAMESLGGGKDAIQAVLDFLRVLRPLPIMNRNELEDYIIGDGIARCGSVVTGSEGSDASGSDSTMRLVAEVLAGMAMFVFRRAREDGVEFQNAAAAALGAFDEFPGPTSMALYEGKVGVLEEIFVEAMGCDEYDADGTKDVVSKEATLLFVLNECLATCGEALLKSAASRRIVLAMSRANQRLGQYKSGSMMALARSEAADVVAERIHMSCFAEAAESTDEEFHRFIQDQNKDARDPQAWFAILSSASKDLERLIALGELFVRDQLASVTGPVESSIGTVASCLANSLWLHGGVELARTFFDQVLKGPLPSAKFISEVARIEQGQVQGPLDIPRIRRVFDIGTEVYGGASVELWLEYYAFERSLGGTVTKADNVHWRATMALEDADDFVMRAQAISR